MKFNARTVVAILFNQKGSCNNRLHVFQTHIVRHTLSYRPVSKHIATRLTAHGKRNYSSLSFSQIHPETKMTTKEPFQRLPTNVKPVNYDITLKPNLKAFTFEGSETISVEVGLPRLLPAIFDRPITTTWRSKFSLCKVKWTDIQFCADYVNNYRFCYF